MTDEPAYPYECPEHGGYREHSHHCPGCIGEAREILKIMYLLEGKEERQRAVDRLLFLFFGCPKEIPCPSRITLECTDGEAVMDLSGRYIFTDSGLALPSALRLLPRERFRRVEIEAL